jgi:peptide/nickel transport system ATP-binding protein
VSPRAVPGAPLLQVSDLAVSFRSEGRVVPAVRSISFDLAKGETLALVGESGSGKSSVAMAVLQLLPYPTAFHPSGSIRFAGRELVGADEKAMQQLRGSRMALIPQEPLTALNPLHRVERQVAEAMRLHRPGIGRDECRDRVLDLLRLVGVRDPVRRMRSYPHELSGGQRQRVMIAIALANEPDLLIADEPTTALDVTIQAQVLDLLATMRRELGMAVMFITHDLGVVADICDRVVVMYAGQIVERADIDDLYRQPKHPYTEGLLTAMPQVGDRTERLASIPGAPPAPWAQPTGCRFHPRCPYCVEKCTEGLIPLFEVGPGRESRCVRVDELTLKGSA